jgi:hypothetical protein
MGWTMLYLFVFLKLPILAACWIVWWAVRQGGDEAEVRGDGGGRRPVPQHPHHPRRPRRPPPPRRGPHAGAVPPSPPRIRSVTAAGRARELER